jgi:hypothetical protein
MEQKNIYKISSHEIKGKEITFYHYDQVLKRNPSTNLYEIVGYQEVPWFKAKCEGSIFLSSNGRFHSGFPSCSDWEVRNYINTNKLAKLISSRVLDNYDEDPYGRTKIIGKYTFEEWQWK